MNASIGKRVGASIISAVLIGAASVGSAQAADVPVDGIGPATDPQDDVVVIEIEDDEQATKSSLVLNVDDLAPAEQTAVADQVEKILPGDAKAENAKAGVVQHRLELDATADAVFDIDVGSASGIELTEAVAVAAAPYVTCGDDRTVFDERIWFNVQNACTQNSAPWTVKLQPSVREIIVSPAVVERGMNWTVDGSSRTRQAQHSVPKNYIFHGTFSKLPGAKVAIQCDDRWDFTAKIGSTTMSAYVWMTGNVRVGK